MKLTTLLLASLALAWSASAPIAAEARPKPSHAPASKPSSSAKTPSRSDANATTYASREDAMLFADDLAARRNLDREWVRAAIARARYLPGVPRLMVPAPRGTAKNWNVYRSRFIDPVRIAAGVRFWRRNAETLARAERDFGVPPEIVVGIVGVETIYGRNMGSFRILDTLSTLAFDFPQAHPRAAERQAYFRGELETFLANASRIGDDPTRALGSYAGATGMPQFMPSSSDKYAIDYDGDGRIDLSGSEADVIGSVANYFKGYGWQRGMPSTYAVRFDPQRLRMDVLMAPDILPTFSADAFVAGGAVLDASAQKHKGLLALIELQNGPDAPVYVAGTENFYVITRYNWSSYYAMSVLDLGHEVKMAMEQP